ncbi:hypothetical protein [Kribbella deserti]|uniref:Uncharacterized protein n=1 Tax=Kribbella deserti TaxID=1926257 RepID=A0ABV6QVM9_9ACTN
MKSTIRRAFVMTVALAAAATGAGLAADTAANATVDMSSTQATVSVAQRPSYLTASPTGKLTLNVYGLLALKGTLKAKTLTGSIVPLKHQTVRVQARRAGETAYRDVVLTGTNALGVYGDDFALGSHHIGADIRVAFRSPYQTIASDFTYVGKIVAQAKFPSVLTTSMPKVLRPAADGTFNFHGYLKVKHPSGKLVPLSNTIVMVRAMGGSMTRYERIAFSNPTSKSGYFTTGRIAGMDGAHGHKIQFLFKSKYGTIASSALYVGKIA